MKLSKYHMYFIAVSVIIFYIFYIVFGMSPMISEKDRLEYLMVGINLSQNGRFLQDLSQDFYFTREPVLPILIATFDKIIQFFGIPRLSTDCFIFSSSIDPNRDLYSMDPNCVSLERKYILLHVPFILSISIGSFFAIYMFTSSYIAAGVGFFLSGLSGGILREIDRLGPEVEATSILLFISIFFVILLKKFNATNALILGILVSILVLIKVIFIYLWIFIITIILMHSYIENIPWKKIVVVTIVFCSAYWAIVGGYMYRNYLGSGEFSVVQGRAYRVISVRAMYNTMRIDEWLAGFIEYAGFDPADFGIPKESYERLSTVNEYGFRRTAQRKILERTNELLEEKLDLNEIHKIIRGEKIEEIKSNPVKHLLTSIIITYRGIFSWRGFGFIAEKSSPTFGDSAGFPNTRWGDYLDVPTRAAYSLSGALLLLIFPLIIWRKYRSLAGLAFCAASIYCFAFYGGFTHFIIRYSIPTLPVRDVVLVASVVYGVHAVLKRTNHFQNIIGARSGLRR